MKADGIVKWVSLIMVVILSLAGCSVCPGSKAQPEPVSFDHPDEVVKGEGFMVLADRRISMRFQNDPKWTALRESQVARDTKEGLNLTQPFYSLMAEYEQSGKPFDQFLPTMLDHLPEYSR